MEEDCHICRNPLNLDDRFPVEICRNRHSCCILCLQSILQQQSRLCPFCRISVPQLQVQQRKKQARQNRDKKKLHLKKLELVQKMASIPYLTQRQKNAIIWREYRKMRQTQGFQTACQFLKEHIQEELTFSCIQIGQIYSPIRRNIKNDQNFIGLGVKNQRQGFSECLGYQWYQKKYNLAELSLYDQLAVAFMVEGYKQSDWLWYEAITINDPSNYKELFGMAHLFCRPSYEGVIFSTPYQQIIELKPEFDKPYEVIAFMYLELNALSRAFEYASQCLKRNPNNIFAEFILTVSDTILSSQEKIQKLSKIVEKEPNYVRAQQSLGKQLSKIGRNKQAIEYYQKCLQIDHNYLSSIIDWAVSLIDVFQYQGCHRITIKMVLIIKQKRQALPKLQIFPSYCLLKKVGVAESSQ